MEAKTQVFLNKQMALFHWLGAVSKSLGIEPVKPKEDYKYDLFPDLTSGVVFLNIFKIVTGREINCIPDPKSIAEKLVNLTEVQSLANTELNVGVFSELDINQYVVFQFYKKLLVDYYEVAVKMTKKYSNVLPPMEPLGRAPQTNKYGGQIFRTSDLTGEAYYANSARLLVSLRMAIRDLACKADPWTGIAQLLGKEENNMQATGDYSRISSQAVVPPQLASICNRASVLREENYILESLAHVLTRLTEENNQYINQHVDNDNSKIFDSKTSTFGKIYRDSMKIQEKTKNENNKQKTAQNNNNNNNNDYTVSLCKGLKKANTEQADLIEKKTSIATILNNETSMSMNAQTPRSPSPQLNGNTQNTVMEIEEPKAGAIIPEINHDPEVVATNTAYEVQLKDMKLRMNKSGDQLTKLKNKNVQQAAAYSKLNKKVKEVNESLVACNKEYKDVVSEYKKMKAQCSQAIADYKGTDLKKIDISRSPKNIKNKQSLEAMVNKKRENIKKLHEQLEEIEKNIDENEIKLEKILSPAIEVQE